jgi:hypothetical protein
VNAQYFMLPLTSVIIFLIFPIDSLLFLEPSHLLPHTMKKRHSCPPALPSNDFNGVNDTPKKQKRQDITSSAILSSGENKLSASSSSSSVTTRQTRTTQYNTSDENILLKEACIGYLKGDKAYRTQALAVNHHMLHFLCNFTIQRYDNVIFTAFVI